MNFKEFYKINERTIGLSPQELEYVDILMQRIKENCVPDLWELGYAGLSSKSLDNFDNTGFGLIIHDFEEEPFNNLRISVYAYHPSEAGSYAHEPYVSTVPYKRLASPIAVKQTTFQLFSRTSFVKDVPIPFPLKSLDTHRS